MNERQFNFYDFRGKNFLIQQLFHRYLIPRQLCCSNFPLNNRFTFVFKGGIKSSTCWLAVSHNLHL